MSRQHSNRRSIHPLAIAIAVAILAVMVLWFRPWMPGPDRGRAGIKAANHAKYLWLALQDFDAEYGSLPGPHTVEEVRKRTGTRLDLSGNSANAIFRQLIAAGLLKDEPVGFAYVMDGDRALPTLRNDLILAAAPFPDASGRFDPLPYQGKGIAIRADGAIRMLDLERGSGRMPIGNGKTLLDTGPGTLWGTEFHPVLRLPKRP